MTDLTEIPDADINKEYWRRIHAKRVTVPGSGRQKKLRPCPKCGEQFGGREIRAHIAKCTVKLKNADHRYLVERGWAKAGENRMGNRTQFLWTHPRFSGRTFTTESAMMTEALDNKPQQPPVGSTI